jgi:hypothetical protein
VSGDNATLKKWEDGGSPLEVSKRKGQIRSLVAPSKTFQQACKKTAVQKTESKARYNEKSRDTNYYLFLFSRWGSFFLFRLRSTAAEVSPDSRKRMICSNGMFSTSMITLRFQMKQYLSNELESRQKQEINEL